MTAAGRQGRVGTCPSCGEPVDARDSFCEACGTELAPPVVSAGATRVRGGLPGVPVDPAAAARRDHARTATASRAAARCRPAATTSNSTSGCWPG